MYAYGPRIATGTPQSTNPAPSPARPVAVAQIAETVNAACNCAAWAVATDQPEDVDTDRLRVLVESGVPHWDACRSVWPADEEAEDVA